MRLNQYIANSGVASRRKADEIIKNNKVTINSKRINKPYYQVKNSDTVKINKQTIKPEKKVYLLVNKPQGVTATCSDRFAKTTILELIPKKILDASSIRIYPIGRLDKDSTGLLILTNDGDFCYKLTHPKFEIEKEYILQLSRQLKKEDYQKSKNGIIDKNQILKVKKITPIRKKDSIKVIVTEGKKRHIRRLFGNLGYRILSLKRVRIGQLRLNDLEEGRFKIISATEIKKYLGINE